MALEEVAGQLAHLDEKAKIALLDLRRRFGTLEDLDQADHFQVGPQRSEDEQKLGGVGRFVVAEAGMRRHQRAVAPDNVGVAEQLVEQAVVAFLLLFALNHAGLLEIELVLERELAVLARRPDHAADGGQSGNHAVEKRFVELAWGQVLPRQLRDFTDQSLDLPTSLLDQLVIRLLVTAHSTTWKLCQ